MNQLLKKLEIHRILFFDIHLSKLHDKLDNPTVKHLFQLKNRDIAESDLDALYEDKGLTMLGFNKISSIAVAYVKDGLIRSKVLTGSEEDLIREFCELTKSFQVLAGVNSIGFKLPLIHINGSRYFDMTELLHDNFIVSGKKPWDIKFVIDITEQFKGTYFISPNLYDMCYHFGISFSLEDDIASDIISTVMLYGKMAGIELNVSSDRKLVLEEKNMFEMIYEQGLKVKGLSEYVKRAKKEGFIEQAKELILSAYVHNNFAVGDEDKKEVKLKKQQEVEELFND